MKAHSVILDEIEHEELGFSPTITFVCNGVYFWYCGNELDKALFINMFLPRSIGRFVQ